MKILACSKSQIIFVYFFPLLPSDHIAGAPTLLLIKNVFGVPKGGLSLAYWTVFAVWSWHPEILLPTNDDLHRADGAFLFCVLIKPDLKLPGKGDLDIAGLISAHCPSGRPGQGKFLQYLWSGKTLGGWVVAAAVLLDSLVTEGRAGRWLDSSNWGPLGSSCFCPSWARRGGMDEQNVLEILSVEPDWKGS